MSRAAVIILSVITFCSCSNSDSKTITIGTFNIEWLGDGIDDKKPRSETDYINIANVIKQSDVDFLALQEVENEAALEKIIEYLPDYYYYISNASGDQKLACLYKKGNKLKVGYIGDYYPLAFDKRLKPGMALHIRKGNTNIPLLIVHFKATSSNLYTDEENSQARSLRYRQAMIANYWADSVIKKAKKKELIILGDFNDYVKPVQDSGNTLLPLSSNKNLVFLTKNLKSCKYRKWNAIDQIVISNELKKKLKKNSIRMFDFNMTLKDSEAAKISDHCPVLFELEFK